MLLLIQVSTFAATIAGGLAAFFWLDAVAARASRRRIYADRLNYLRWRW